MKKSLLVGLFFLALFMCAVPLLDTYAPKVNASQEKGVSISDIKISKPIDDTAVSVYEVRIAVAEKTDTSIKLTRACFTKDLSFCILVIERGNEAITWVAIGRLGVYQLSVYLEYEYVIAGEREPKRGKSNEITTTIIVHH